MAGRGLSKKKAEILKEFGFEDEIVIGLTVAIIDLLYPQCSLVEDFTSLVEKSKLTEGRMKVFIDTLKLGNRISQVMSMIGRGALIKDVLEQLNLKSSMFYVYRELFGEKVKSNSDMLVLVW